LPLTKWLPLRLPENFCDPSSISPWAGCSVTRKRNLSTLENKVVADGELCEGGITVEGRSGQEFCHKALIISRK
jgi:hypothetical protein